ncbi:hypothetical protein KIW84_054793 [Lathyrus oleraceus]|uniref:Uncharacterized protein n=1 Tax=Pisum sativum TaxID=3888 RepID=A0A9D4WU14_PEA|nr:hypothetical protein KIW84_054793 [Pisum sativum]
MSQPDSNSYDSAIDEAIRLVNAYDSRKFAGKSSNSYGGASNNKKDGRVCTFCHKTGHTIDVCYRKHGFPPKFTRKQTSTNASNAVDTQNMMNTGIEGSLNNSSDSITQEQYAQLIGFLQQTNLLPSNPTPNPSANHISTHFSHTPNENSGKLFVSTVSCSTYIKPDFWILDSGANDHDVKTKKMIGSANQVEGLYRLRTDIDSIPA